MHFFLAERWEGVSKIVAYYSDQCSNTRKPKCVMQSGFSSLLSSAHTPDQVKCS